MLKKTLKIVFFIFGLVAFLRWAEATSSKEKLLKFLPQVPGWFFSQEPEFYHPENLFEYINGASEAYLAYDFQGLIVGFYQREKDPEPVITVEIYDMGETIKAYGIYSSERPMESDFIDLGFEGYLESGHLYFFTSSYYIKIFSFLPPEEAEKTALLFGREIDKLIPKDKEWLPPARLFPPLGLKPYSIKFILKNFLGFAYLHHAWVASYERNGQSFEAFILQAQNEREAELMEARWKKELASTSEKLEEKNFIFKAINNKYFNHIYLQRFHNFLLGIIRLTRKDDDLALNFLRELQNILKNRLNGHH